MNPEDQYPTPVSGRETQLAHYTAPPNFPYMPIPLKSPFC